MSVNWQDSTSPARLKAVTAANESGEFDHTVPTWSIYADLREALIYALLMTGFPGRSEWAITEDNWRAVYVRLQILEQVRGCYRVYNNGAGTPRSMWFTPEEIKSMVGMSVNAGNKTDAQFRKRMFDLMTEDATAQLPCFSPDKDEDPYRWEKLHNPKRHN